MQHTRGILNFVIGLFLVSGLLADAPALRAWDTDPNGLYGGCSGDYGSAFRNKSDHVYSIGKSLANVVGIVVLDCHTFDGPGDTYVVPCPPSTPYSYCLRNMNDGVGNDVYLGVLELNSTTDPNTEYGGCAAGSGFRIKSDVLRSSINLRQVDSIVVTKCQAADGPARTQKVNCPPKSMYAGCFVNKDDGVGNHVEFGVITNFGAGDPNGLYGGYFKTSRFRTKSVLVTELGKSLDKVTSIVTLTINRPIGRGGSELMPCNYVPNPPFSYCIINRDDGVGNSVQVGVVEGP